jgi:hypothetical protein
MHVFPLSFDGMEDEPFLIYCCGMEDESVLALSILCMHSACIDAAYSRIHSTHAYLSIRGALRVDY